VEYRNYREPSFADMLAPKRGFVGDTGHPCFREERKPSYTDFVACSSRTMIGVTSPLRSKHPRSREIKCNGPFRFNHPAVAIHAFKAILGSN
jgi:hypothetical protein